MRLQGLTGSTSTHRREIQLEVENLREEMSNMDMEAPTLQMHNQIGKGAFGVVYQGTWRGLDVAIKRTIFQVGCGDDGIIRTRFLVCDQRPFCGLDRANVESLPSFRF